MVAHVNTVTAIAVDDDNNSDTATDDATVTFDDVLPDITIDKSANVSSAAETGGNVTFTFVINNLNGEEVTLTSIEDDKFTSDDLLAAAVAANGNSDVLAGGGSVTFQITKFLTGDDLVAHVNTVIAIAVDDDNNSDTAMDDATVTFDDVLPDITVLKNPSVTAVPETGANVTFTFDVTNNSTETANLDSLTDSDFGNLVTLGVFDSKITLAPGASISGTYTTFISGNYESGISHNNVFTATASDNDGNSDIATDDATVSFTDVTAQIDVEKYVWDGDSWEDADMASGPILNQGTNPQFKFVVTNTGTGVLSNVTLTDSDFNIDTTSGDKIYEIGNLAVNGSKELIFTAPWTAGQHTNTATAYGSFTDGAGNIESATDSDDANYFGECPPCEFDIFESFSGPNINVTIKLEEYVNESGNDAGVKFTVTETDPNLIGDLRGVFFHVDPDTDTPDPLTGLNVTGTYVTEYRVKKDSIQDLGDGVNMNGDGNRHKYDVGVEIGTQGIGKDDIQSTVFIVSNPKYELNVDNFADVEFGVRLTSVGQRGSNRNESSKIFGFSPEDCGCEIIPSFASLPVLANAGSVI